MIPLRLTLKYFLSYQEATLDFTGLHTACICGANGAGKSSLLEAMTWAIWGKSRAKSDDDVIQAGADHVRVDFTFQMGSEIYRVIRGRSRGRSPELQFQIQTVAGQFRAISAKGVRATQNKIDETLKIDYDTFINSAYLRQGHADEFMQSSPQDRKKVLADLLKLEQYEILATRAKEATRQFKTHHDVLRGQLAPRKDQLAERDPLTVKQAERKTAIATLTHQHKATQKEYETLREQSRDRRSQEEQLHWHQTQFQRLLADAQRLTQEETHRQQQITALQAQLERQDEIAQNYQQRQAWQAQQTELAQKFQVDRQRREQRQQLLQQLEQAKTQIQLAIQQTQTEYRGLSQQEQELAPLLNQATSIQTALEQLQQCRQHLQRLEQVQVKVAPLNQRRQSLQLEIGQVEARFRAQWDSLGREKNQLLDAKAQGQPLRQQLLGLDAQVKHLENQRVYQQRVVDKAQEQHATQAKLEAQIQGLSQELTETEQTWQRLNESDAHCPLCEQSLSEDYRQQVLTKTHQRQEQIQQQIWLLREQIAECEHQREQLNQESRKLEQELAGFDRLVQQQGQVEAKLERMVELQEQIWELAQRLQEMERSLTTGEYALDLKQELQALETAIADLDYDEQRHSQLRTQERELRWSELKAAKLQDAQQRLQAIAERRPQLEQQLQAQQTKLANLEQDSPLQQQIQTLDHELKTLGYDGATHQELLQNLQRSQTWELDYQNLQQAQQRLPELTEQLTELQVRQTHHQGEQTAAEKQIQAIIERMESLPDHRPALEALEEKLQQQQQELDSLRIEQGKTEQQLTQLTELAAEVTQTQERLTWLQQQERIYRELTQAFGKNGIQALMIENLLPQLEAETNLLLARLTGNQLHVQFVTQKATKASRSKKKATKMIDTLDILIADVQGTRPYETYSGGEAFRINFAIRLALAKLLAQRSGAALQMLIIDEGFGTQDAAGCDRLIAAINAIASDFACILTVTHMPQFKAAFTHRIEVHKTENGSQLQLTN